MFELEQQRIENAIKALCADAGVPVLDLKWNQIPFSGEWGMTTSFFATAAAEARSGKKVVVPARAQEIAELVRTGLGDIPGFSRIQAVNGYLNLYFSTPEYTRRVLDTVIEQADSFGRLPRRGEQVMVEHSQPNTHKPFHVGHLRNVILGSSICNILDAAGYDVIRANYLGDIGLHVIKWLWAYMAFHRNEQPPEDTVRWMGDIYAEATRHFEDNPEVEKEVRQLFSRWHHGDAELEELWQTTRQWCLDAFSQIYEMMGVRFDHYYFESEVEKPGIELVEELITRGIARDERPSDSVIVPLDELLGLENEYKVLVVLRSDGTSLYSTKDLALAIQKFNEFKLSKSIYVIDVRQSFYLKQIYKTLEIMGHADLAEKCHHLAYEIVNLPGNVTMSSREGTVVLLEDLVREARSRARSIVAEKNPELADEVKDSIAFAVAMGSIKYSMLSKDNTKVVTFDWERAMDFNGQAAPYIQYAFVRAGSILRKVNHSLPPSVLPQYELHPAEVQLVDQLTRLPGAIQRAADEYRPLHLATLAYEMAKAFNDFYNQCPVAKAEPAMRANRIRLVAAARQAIGNCLMVLGIIAPEAM